MRRTGALRLVANSNWRRGRLLILGYHGVAIEDEHEWDGSLYLRADDLEARLRLLQKERYSVLGLDDAVRRLRAGTLPERSAALTFDDGYFDFLARAYPLLASYRMPATVYLSTYYSTHNHPVFNVVCSYLLWKGRRGRLATAALAKPGGPSFDLSRPGERAGALAWLKQFAREAGLNGDEKDDLAARLAGALGVDWEELLSKRILHLLKPAEVGQLSACGVDFELHTYRHRVPREGRAFRDEIVRNRQDLAAMTGKTAAHFCYPSGDYAPEFLPWLTELGVETATTCRPGIATRSSHPLLLPRLIDSANLTMLEFESWLSGAGSLLPRRPGAGMPGAYEGA
ncbi:MAG TPA: polysaccharide deacetylase family protein [Bryobacteraceae bacterium]|nr:polysaccharide deacetylase family protein [Bryobacteraceae bacterium]